MVRGKSGSSSSTHYEDDHGSNNKSLRDISKVFAKRTMGLKKKIYELTTLCDLDGCLIVKGPNGELETWPENRHELEHVLERYYNMNEDDRQKNTRDISSFLIDKKKKLELDIDKIRNENDSKMKSLYPTWNKKFDELSEDSLREIRCSLESKLENVKSRVEMKQQMRGDDYQKEINTALTTTSSSTINPYFVRAENFDAMGGGLNPPLIVPQTREFFDFHSSHHLQQQQNLNLFPIRGTMSSMYNPGFGMMETHQHYVNQYYTNLMGDAGNYSTDLISLPPLLPTTAICFHDQPPPLQTCVPADAPSFQTGEYEERFLNSIYSNYQQYGGDAY